MPPAAAAPRTRATIIGFVILQQRLTNGLRQRSGENGVLRQLPNLVRALVCARLVLSRPRLHTCPYARVCMRLRSRACFLSR